MEPMRLDKYLAHQGIVSRREAKTVIEQGLISVNGKKVKESGIKIGPHDTVQLDQKISSITKEKETVMINKPRGFISSKDQDGNKNVFDRFPALAHLNTVGRLDKESEGLLILSNDGLITKAITGKDHKLEKEYIVTVRENILPWMMEKMSNGIKLRDGWTKPAHAHKINRHTFSITLREGRKHQIRRMANACKLTVTSLKRVRIHTIELGRLKPGQWRRLKKHEVTHLKAAGL